MYMNKFNIKVWFEKCWTVPVTRIEQSHGNKSIKSFNVVKN